MNYWGNKEYTPQFESEEQQEFFQKEYAPYKEFGIGQLGPLPIPRKIYRVFKPPTQEAIDGGKIQNSVAGVLTSLAEGLKKAVQQGAQFINTLNEVLGTMTNNDLIVIMKKPANTIKAGEGNFVTTFDALPNYYLYSQAKKKSWPLSSIIKALFWKKYGGTEDKPYGGQVPQPLKDIIDNRGTSYQSSVVYGLLNMIAKLSKLISATNSALKRLSPYWKYANKGWNANYMQTKKIKGKMMSRLGKLAKFKKMTLQTYIQTSTAGSRLIDLEAKTKKSNESIQKRADNTKIRVQQAASETEQLVSQEYVPKKGFGDFGMPKPKQEPGKEGQQGVQSTVAQLNFTAQQKGQSQAINDEGITAAAEQIQEMPVFANLALLTNMAYNGLGFQSYTTGTGAIVINLNNFTYDQGALAQAFVKRMLLEVGGNGAYALVNPTSIVRVFL